MKIDSNGVVLIVLDGYGIAPPSPGNAITQANLSFMPTLSQEFPHTHLSASGESVGLPAHEAGNTEVGHINLGAGRIIYQSLPRINMSIADGTFFSNDVFLHAVEHVKNNASDMHIIGLMGSGMVHASMDHLYALLYLCKEQQLQRVFIHAITDGRDSPPKSAESYLQLVQQKIDRIKLGRIATVMGRYYAMDRDLRWDRVELAYRCLTLGGDKKASSWMEAVSTSYAQGQTDEFIKPTNIYEGTAPGALIKPGDGVIFYNYRIDRPRELTKAFVLDDFKKDANKISYDPFATKYYSKHEVEQPTLSLPFERGKKLENVFFATMTEYDKELPVSGVAYPPHVVENPLGEILAHHDIAQLRLSESEKERFVTFYFSGLREEAFSKEDRVIEPSPKVPTYDKKPEMSADKLTEQLIKKISSKKYKFILLNFANPDMVGHTGNLPAAIKALQFIDGYLKEITAVLLEYNYTGIITADHGNIEEMIDLTTGEVSTEHTQNLVPCHFIANQLKGKSIHLQPGILADIAPTILNLLDIPKPDTMTGRNLLEEL